MCRCWPLYAGADWHLTPGSGTTGPGYGATLCYLCYIHCRMPDVCRSSLWNIFCVLESFFGPAVVLCSNIYTVYLPFGTTTFGKGQARPLLGIWVHHTYSEGYALDSTTQSVGAHRLSLFGAQGLVDIRPQQSYHFIPRHLFLLGEGCKIKARSWSSNKRVCSTYFLWKQDGGFLFNIYESWTVSWRPFFFICYRWRSSSCAATRLVHIHGPEWSLFSCSHCLEYRCFLRFALQGQAY